MKYLIDKSALVAEMNKLKNISLEYGYTTEQRIVADVGKDLTLKGLLDYIDTLEVKEVDLEKEVIDWWNTNYPNKDFKDYAFKRYSGHYLENSTVINIAKHFFELGMQVSNKTQKGEEL